jgi:GNAT superfamily N-acetyltransferase
LPAGFVAWEDGTPAGFAALKSESLPTHKHLAPWAAAGLVLQSHRGRGIGQHLLRALVKHARDLGFDHVYCGTATAITLLRRGKRRPGPAFT